MWVEPERHDTHSSKAYGSYGHANLNSIDASSVHSGWVSYGVQRSNATASVRADAKDRKFAKVPVSTFHIYSSTTTSPLTKNPRPGVLKSLKTPPLEFRTSKIMLALTMTRMRISLAISRCSAL